MKLIVKQKTKYNLISICLFT